MSNVSFSARRFWFVRLPLVLAALALLWFALHTVSWPEVWRVLRHIRPTPLVLLIAVNGVILLTFSARWWLLLRAQGHAIAYVRLARYRMAAFSVSYFTPGPHFGGEPLQVYLVQRRHGVPGPDAVAAVALDKTIELIFNFTILIAGFLLIWQYGFLDTAWDTAPAIRHVTPTLVVLAAPLGLLIAYQRGLHPFSAMAHWLWRALQHPLGWLARWLSAPDATPDAHLATRLFLPLFSPNRHEAYAAMQYAIRRSETRIVALCRQHPRVLAAAALVSVANWLLLLGEFWLAIRVLGFDLTPGQALFVLIATRVAILLPMPAGLGALESSLVLAMQSLGLNASAGISLSLLIRSRDLLVGGIGLWLGGVDVRQIQKEEATDEHR